MRKNLCFAFLSAALIYSMPFASAQTQAQQSQIQSSTDTQSHSSTVGTQTVTTHPDSSPLQDALGRPQNLQYLLGQKTIVLVINNRPDPHLSTLANQYKEDVVILNTQPSSPISSNTGQIMGQTFRAAEPNLWAATETAERILGGPQNIPSDADRLDADRPSTLSNTNTQNYYLIIDKNRRVHSVGVISFDTRTTEAKNHELSEALAAVAVASSPGVGAINTDRMDQDRASRIGQTPRENIGAQDLQQPVDRAHLIRSDNILDVDVENKSGEDLGEVDTFLVDLRSGKVAYALLSVGGVLGLGDKKIAVPWSALQFQGANQDDITVDIAKDRLEDLPNLEDRDEEAFTDPNWHKQVSSTYGIAPQTYTQLIRLNELKSFKVRNSAGEDLGEIEELMIDIRNGNCPFAVLEFGGFLGIGDKLVAIPWDKFKIDSSNETVVLDIPKDRLENAPNFERDNWPGADDNIWTNNTIYFTQ